MKVLNFNNQEFKADTIIKTDTDTIGYDSSGNEIFSFKGISDFSGFTVKNEDGTNTNFDTMAKTELELLKETVDALVLANLGV